MRRHFTQKNIHSRTFLLEVRRKVRAVMESLMWLGEGAFCSFNYYTCRTRVARAYNRSADLIRRSTERTKRDAALIVILELLAQTLRSLDVSANRWKETFKMQNIFICPLDFHKMLCLKIKFYRASLQSSLQHFAYLQSRVQKQGGVGLLQGPRA